MGQGNSSWGSSLLCSLFTWQINKATLSLSSKLYLHISVQHQCPESPEFGSKRDLSISAVFSNSFSLQYPRCHDWGCRVLNPISSKVDVWRATSGNHHGHAEPGQPCVLPQGCWGRLLWAHLQRGPHTGGAGDPIPWDWVFTPDSSLSPVVWETETPSRWKKLIIKDDMLPISMWTPDLLDLKVDSYSPHHQPIRSMSMSWSSPLRTITIKLLTLFSSLGHMALRVLVHCGPIYLAK